MQICVTQEDIRSGRPLKPCLCPVAKAIQRMLGPKYYVSVSDRITIRQHVGSQVKWYRPFSMNVKNFVTKFDGSKHVEPFDFEIDIPEEYLCKSQ